MNPTAETCPDCGHRHAGPEVGGICVGCPCQAAATPLDRAVIELHRLGYSKLAEELSTWAHRLAVCAEQLSAEFDQVESDFDRLTAERDRAICERDGAVRALNEASVEIVRLNAELAGMRQRAAEAVATDG